MEPKSRHDSECPTDSPEELSRERIRLDAYRVSLRKGVIGIVVWGRSSCYCSPTGNCAFWIFRQGSKGYEPLLETDMVQDFGFLSSRTNGYRDLVARSHGSAFQSGYRTFGFQDGTYQSYCDWDEEYDPEEDEEYSDEEENKRRRFSEPAKKPAGRGRGRPPKASLGTPPLGANRMRASRPCRSSLVVKIERTSSLADLVSR